MTVSMILAASWLDTLDTGSKVLLFGMAATIVLLLIIARLCFKIYNNTCKSEEGAINDTPITAPVAPGAPAKAAEDAAIVAAITAAIQAYRDADGSSQTAGFRVVSFRRK